MTLRALLVWRLAFHQAACDNRLPNRIHTVHLAVHKGEDCPVLLAVLMLANVDAMLQIARG